MLVKIVHSITGDYGAHIHRVTQVIDGLDKNMWSIRDIRHVHPISYDVHTLFNGYETQVWYEEAYKS